MLTYARAPSSEFLTFFEEGALLSRLREPLHCVVDGRCVALDLQFRSNDEVMLYCGQTCVVTIGLRRGGIVATAHKSYTGQACAAALMRRWVVGEPRGAFTTALAGYLASVQVRAQFLNEGAVHVRWLGNDPSSVGGPPWIPLDREAELGHESVEARERLFQHFGLGRAFDSLEALATREGWRPGPPPPGKRNKLDQLGVVADGSAIVMIELKATKASDAHYAPFQLMRYVAEWSAVLASTENRTLIRGALEGISHAKARLGLLSKPPTLIETPVLRPIVAFNDPPSRGAMRKLRSVEADLHGTLGDVLPVVRALEIWAWPDGGPAMRLD